jgi:hypothetical protein
VIGSLRWGLATAVPADAIAAWGCRAIVHQDGYVDIPPDRTDQQGSEVIFTLLDVEFPLLKLRETLGAMLGSGQVSTRRRGQFVLFKSDRLTVVGDTNASAGYCYLAAWTARSEETS